MSSTLKTNETDSYSKATSPTYIYINIPSKTVNFCEKCQKFNISWSENQSIRNKMV